MSTAPKKRAAPINETTPQTPQTTPPPFSPVLHDHSFTLQAVMELQKSVGELNVTLQTVKSSVDSTKAKVDDLVNWKHKILGGAAVLGFVIAAGGFAVAKLSDYVTVKTPPSLPAQAAPATAQSAPLKP